MKSFIKLVLSQQAINYFYHLPRAVLANIGYGFPTRGLKIVGITGTDGKTTTTNMVYQILKEAGKKVSMVSTVNAVVGGKTYDTGFHVTSPDPFAVQKFAKLAKKSGDEYLVLEVTSHALDQYRFWGIKFEVGVVTNITHDHLDYHKTLANYTYTKLKLVKNAKYAIVNQGIRGVQRIKSNTVTFGLNRGDFNQKQIKLKLRIPGEYNIENGLAALAVAFALGIDRKIAEEALEDFHGVSGRMEEISNNRGIKIIVDFAHTPNGLESALKTLRKQARNKLIAVFGAAGKRDVAKRSVMGQIAGHLADFIIITAEDPRGELEDINKQIISGATKAGKEINKNLFVINDRKEAIGFAINKLAAKGDIVGIFGKGHEKSLNLDGKKEIPWSDQEAVESILDGSLHYKKALTR